ncbi:hypothetical protein CDAR_477101, partial [Caerostris darwini]
MAFGMGVPFLSRIGVCPHDSSLPPSRSLTLLPYSEYRSISHQFPVPMTQPCHGHWNISNSCDGYS